MIFLWNSVVYEWGNNIVVCYVYYMYSLLLVINYIEVKIKFKDYYYGEK